jgi:hypothetical protein
VFVRFGLQFGGMGTMSSRSDAGHAAIVFDSNAAALEKVNDPENPELLGKIVTIYSAARSLLDSINYNNQRYQAWNPRTPSYA